MPLVIIPAAGHGKRVGQPEAKELLLDESGRPLIEWGLDLVQERGWPCLVITRAQKRSLIRYLGARSQADLQIQIIEDSKEWPHTLLLSQNYWWNRNIILLPDTRWGPVSALDEINQGLRLNPYSFAVFSVADFSTWGTVNPDGWACEKPGVYEALVQDPQTQAWGLFGFQRDHGKELLQKLLLSTLSHESYKLAEKPQILRLDFFQDLTRGEGARP